MNSPNRPVLATHRIAVFMPGRQNDDEIRASFMARESTLALILEDIASTRDGGIPQHHLVIGQRGMGKTTLLRRLDLALREVPLATRFIPLSFPEEQWAVDRLSAFWLNCLDAFADTLERESHAPGLIDKIDRSIETIRADTSPEALVAESAEISLLALARELGRLPVLLVDNLDLVFGRLSKTELSVLRAFLMKAGAPILIGASIYPPDQTQDYSAPFYDQFKTHHLSRLSLEEMREVILRLAEHTGNREIPQRFDSEVGRLRALHALTGGNPRTTVILFQIFSRGFSQEAYQDLEALLDWVTPLYKARLEELSDQAQVIVSALALHWEPATSAVIGERTRLKNGQVSSNLDRLKKAGIVEETTVDQPDRTGPLPESGSPKDRTGFQIAERFLNIWFLMRQATRRDKRNLAFLTRFIECVHTAPERDRMAADLLGKPELSRSEQIFGLALESAIEGPGLRVELRDHVHQTLVDALRRHQQQIDDIIDPTEIPAHRWAFAELRDKLKANKPEKLDITPDAFANAILGCVGLVPARQSLAANPLSLRKASSVIEVVAQMDRIIGESAGLPAYQWMQRLLLNASLCDFSDPVQISEAILHAQTKEQAILCVTCANRSALSEIDESAWKIVQSRLQPNDSIINPNAWFEWGRLLHLKFARFDLAEPAYRRAIELNSESHFAWNHLGLLLLEYLNRGAEAKPAFERAIALAPEISNYWYNLGNLQNTFLDNPSEAEASYRKAISLNPEFSRPWLNLGVVLMEKLHRPEEAEAAFRRAVELAPRFTQAWNNLGVALAKNPTRLAKAEECYRRALKIDPVYALSWRNLGDLLNFKLNRTADAAKSYRRSLELDPTHAATWNDLGRILSKNPKRLAEAEDAFRQSVSHDAKNVFPWRNLGALLREQLGRYDEAEAAYREAIALAPDHAGTWNTLGNLLLDDLHRPTDAADAYHRAIALDPTDALCPKCNLVFVLRDHLRKVDEARSLFAEIEATKPEKFLDSLALHRALFAAQDDNGGLATAHLTAALDLLGEQTAFPNNTADDWMRGSAVFLALGLGDKLLACLRERGDDQRRRPWYEALRAHVRGDRRYLRNIPAELREISGQLFDEIARRERHTPRNRSNPAHSFVTGQ